MRTHDNADLIESVYATTLDPAEFDRTIERWVQQIGNRGDRAFDRHLRIAFDLLERTARNDTDPTVPQLELGPDLRILHANSAMRTLYDVSVGDTLDDLPLDASARAEIARTAKRLARAEVPGQPVVVPAWRTDAENSLVVILTPSGTGGCRLQTSELVWTPNLSSLLAESFSLTKAERSVVRLLAEGCSVEQAAAARNASIATVRTQLQSIYQKTRVSGLTELVRLVIGLAAFSPSDARIEEESLSAGRPAPYPRAEHRHLLTLPDGRTLDYAVFGAKGGRPLLLLHDGICGNGWPASAIDEARRLGLQIISPLRPGYGRSEPLRTRRRDTLNTIVKDILYLLDYLGIDSVVIVAKVLGSASGTRLMAIAPERVSGMLAVVPALPIEKQDYAGLSTQHRMLVHAVHANPTLLRYFVRARYALYERYGIHAFLAKVYKSTADREVLADPDCLSAIVHGARACGTRSFRAYYGDVREPFDDMHTVAAAITRPVHILLGAEDANGRLARAQRLAALNPHVTVTVLPKGAELLFYRECHRVLQLAANLHGQPASLPRTAG
ncbi:MAG: alpha/beta fold hydrolase [Pseudomonadales bacterium]|nr:alpha/beta fold hydrolase [Pseudomonadales bacterium]MCP5183737.1 alpha/beta fold hydrolase [Pseudomonadales bacterium]